MNEIIKMSRETKLILLKAMKNGYFEKQDLSHLIHINSPQKSIEEKRAELEELLKHING